MYNKITKLQIIALKFNFINHILNLFFIHQIKNVEPRLSKVNKIFKYNFSDIKMTKLVEADIFIDVCKILF